MQFNMHTCKSFIITLVIAAALLANNFANAQENIPARRPVQLVQRNLAQLFFTSRLTQQDPKKSMACFEDYVLQSNLISNEYGVAYNICLDAEQYYQYIYEKYFPVRLAHAKLAEDICRQLKDCNGRNETLDVFECHANAGTNVTTSVYSLSSSAEGEAIELREYYHNIQLRQENCLRQAERIYVTSSAENFNYLKSCLDGRVEPHYVTEPTTDSQYFVDRESTESIPHESSTTTNRTGVEYPSILKVPTHNRYN